jgi:hypothetical protein
MITCHCSNIGKTLFKDIKIGAFHNRKDIELNTNTRIRGNW